jgi:hypothetical protein
VTEETVRASEITQFLFCRRAWWYAREGYPSDKLQAQLAGVRWHNRHGRTVLAAGCLRLLGYLFLITALVTAAAYLTTLALG